MDMERNATGQIISISGVANFMWETLADSLNFTYTILFAYTACHMMFFAVTCALEQVRSGSCAALFFG